jgi:serine protease Do
VVSAVVRLRIDRRYKAEKMPRYFWPRYLQDHTERWENAGNRERARLIGRFTHAERVLGANQQIRRPGDPTTGVLISPDGYILTSLFNVATDTAYIHKERGLHPITFEWNLRKLLGNPRHYEQKKNPVQNITAMLPDGRRLDAEIVSRHKPLRIALLKIEAAKLPHVDLSQSSARARIGHEAAALGVVGESERVTLNLGVITASARQRGHFFQFGGRINYANSGGPVIDSAGRLLGIATEPLRPGPILGVVLPLHQIVRRWYVAPNSGISFGARIDRIRRDLPRLKAGESVEKLRGAFIGIAMDPAKALSEGAFLGKVVPDSPAERAGLQPGDQILMMDDKTIDSWKELTDAVQQYEVGDRVILTVRRLKEAYRAEIEGNNGGEEVKQESKPPETESQQTEPGKDHTPAPEEDAEEDAEVGEYKVLDIPLTLGERQ